MSKLDLGCPQFEVDGLLKVLASRGVYQIGELLALGTSDRKKLMGEIYAQVKGRVPNSFETVATLAALKSAHDRHEEVELIKAQIAFLDAWTNLKESLRRK